MPVTQADRIVNDLQAVIDALRTAGKVCAFTNGPLLSQPCYCRYCCNKFGPGGRPSQQERAER